MIELQNLHKKYGEKKVYTNVNLVLEENKSYALIGPSGSGKTTLLNAIARLEKPDSGKILLQGNDLWKMKEADYFKNYLGYVFQNYALIEEESVLNNLKMVGKQQDIVATLQKVGLDETYLKAKVYELSGGEAQRVSIARLLLKKAKIILADEPTGALDQATGEAITTLLLELVAPATIVVFATHDPLIFNRVDRVIDVSKL